MKTESKKTKEKTFEEELKMLGFADGKLTIQSNLIDARIQIVSNRQFIARIYFMETLDCIDITRFGGYDWDEHITIQNLKNLITNLKNTKQKEDLFPNFECWKDSRKCNYYSKHIFQWMFVNNVLHAI